MSAFNIEVQSGASVRLPTAGKYCDRDIVVQATGGSTENKLAKLIAGTLEEITEEDLAGVTKIAQSSFYQNKGLKRVSVPQSVTAIESNAFYSCSFIESINLQNGLKSIGGAAFYSIPHYFKGITIPETVTTIGYQAFRYCTNLEKVCMKPTTPPTLGTAVFEYCPNLTEITVPHGCAEAYKTATNWSAYAELIKEEDAGGVTAKISITVSGDTIDSLNDKMTKANGISIKWNGDTVSSPSSNAIITVNESGTLELPRGTANGVDYSYTLDGDTTLGDGETLAVNYTATAWSGADRGTADVVNIAAERSENGDITITAVGRQHGYTVYNASGSAVEEGDIAAGNSVHITGIESGWRIDVINGNCVAFSNAVNCSHDGMSEITNIGVGASITVAYSEVC